MSTRSKKTDWRSEFGVVGLAHKFMLAAEDEGRGFTKAEINALAEDAGMLRDIHDLFLGRARLTHIIGLDAAPFVPSGLSVVEHRHFGQFEFDPAKIALFRSENQKGSKRIKGDDLRKELEDRPVFNANLLDWYLAHPHLIPEDWKGKGVTFWGTIYRRADHYLCVRVLYWFGDYWDWDDRCLYCDWNSDHPAAVPAPLCQGFEGQASI